MGGGLGITSERFVNRDKLVRSITFESSTTVTLIACPGEIVVYHRLSDLIKHFLGSGKVTYVIIS
jgi:hypothetical protein